MINQSEILEISLENGPLTVKSLDCMGATKEILLWDSIVGKETFPACERNYGNYTLVLSKHVETATDIPSIEQQLQNAFIDLSHSWYFATKGALLRIEKERQTKKLFSSNTEVVEKKFLAREGLYSTNSLNFSWKTESSICYEQMPLESAVLLCQICQKEDSKILKNMLECFYKSLTERDWFVHLYKVQELLGCIKNIGRNEVKKKLNISPKEWSHFNKFLNNNGLRHANFPISKCGMQLSAEKEKTKLLKFAEDWIRSYIQVYHKWTN